MSDAVMELMTLPNLRTNQKIVRNYKILPPEEITPLTDAEKAEIATTLEEAEANGEINLPDFCFEPEA